MTANERITAAIAGTAGFGGLLLLLALAGRKKGGGEAAQEEGPAPGSSSTVTTQSDFDRGPSSADILHSPAPEEGPKPVPHVEITEAPRRPTAAQREAARRDKAFRTFGSLIDKGASTKAAADIALRQYQKAGGKDKEITAFFGKHIRGAK